MVHPCPSFKLNYCKIQSAFASIAIQRRSVCWVKSDFGRTSSVTQIIQSLDWRQLDLYRIDCRPFMIYKVTNDVVAIPLEGYLTSIGRYMYRNIYMYKKFYIIGLLILLLSRGSEQTSAKHEFDPASLS